MQHASRSATSVKRPSTCHSRLSWRAHFEPELQLRGDLMPAQQDGDMLSESDLDSELYEDGDWVRVRVAQLGPDVQRAVVSSPTASALGVRGGDAVARRGNVGAGAWAGGAVGITRWRTNDEE